ncbi:hypothetical protein HMPREF0591_1792 [Mycobacterium parascrofulaceum ATCC BAA-614]|uniref:Uncharacterized protein n=1 Tax=Mycobacterium parascrofulaceum ATCC BAA-614 TaxID=525368 RepID=D5P6J8_9MYCO|nr:hypothetical protein HMPREF0591_1792 [Mycobacterium parascrofulaceum ATCC BAA-614]
MRFLHRTKRIKQVINFFSIPFVAATPRLRNRARRGTPRRSPPRPIPRHYYQYAVDELDDCTR